MSVEDAIDVRPGDWILLSPSDMPVPVLSVSLDTAEVVMYVSRRGVPQRHVFSRDAPVRVVLPWPEEVSDD
jgi:hypothetical protein